jgi:diguanylate cyclase
MTAHDPSLRSPAGGLLQWFGLGRSSEGAPPRDQRATLRQHQLYAIGDFLERHRLELSAQTLTAAHACLTGSDPHLVRQVDRRVADGDPVTSEWLDEVHHRHDRVDELAELAALMQRLETSIDEFSKTSIDARSVTNDYNSALEAHVEELDQAGNAGAVISDLANIAKAMLKRTREIEKAMVLNEAETRKLKRNLEVARRSSEEDHLTGLPNRRAFEARFESEFRAARAALEPLCLALCDIDHFKAINDSHGHDAGDRVLRLVAQNLARISDDRCHVARHGGEEFVVLFRDKSLEDAVLALDALRQELAARKFVNRATDSPIGQITFSGGVTDVFLHADRRAALRAADIALYRAKEGGRNRIEVAGAADGHGLTD